MEKIIKVKPIEKLLQYNLSTQIYNQSEDVPVMNFCNGFTVRNIGTNNMTVMGDPLAPNESKAISGNRGEIYVGRIYIQFLAGAGTNQCLITQKYYMNVPFENESSI